MTCSSEEIKVLQERLEAAERAIEELQGRDLFLAKFVSNFLCTIEYNMFLSTRKGEEIISYIDLWSKRLDDTKKEIDDSKTVEGAFEIMRHFDNELIVYITAKKVETAEQAMDIAHAFIKKYSSVALPLKAIREGDVWLVDIDVGALAVKIAKVKVDARTGEILSYEIPEKQTTKEAKGK